VTCIPYIFGMNANTKQKKINHITMLEMRAKDRPAENTSIGDNKAKIPKFAKYEQTLCFILFLGT